MGAKDIVKKIDVIMDGLLDELVEESFEDMSEEERKLLYAEMASLTVIREKYKPKTNVDVNQVIRLGGGAVVIAMILHHEKRDIITGKSFDIGKSTYSNVAFA